MLAFDLYCRECGWQGRAGHDVLRADRVGFGIEIDKIAAVHIDRSDAKTHGPSIDTIEIDQLFECQPEPTGIVKACSLHGAWRMKPRRWKTWRHLPERDWR